MPAKINQIKQSLLLSQLFLFGFLIICSFIKPHIVVINGGVSNFGKYKSTVFLYSLGFLLEIGLLWKAAHQTATLGRRYRNLSWLLKMLSGLSLLVFISTFPRYLSSVYSIIHDDIGIILYAYEFLLSIWFVIKFLRPLTILLLVLESVGSMIGLLSILKIIHFLFFGQFIGAVCFGALLVYVFPLLIDRVAYKYNLEPPHDQ